MQRYHRASEEQLFHRLRLTIFRPTLLVPQQISLIGELAIP